MLQKKLNQLNVAAGSISGSQLNKIEYAIYHDPRLIPTLMRDCSISKGMLYSRLRRAVPHRIGIEFELEGHLGSYLKSDPSIESYYGVLSYEEDSDTYVIDQPRYVLDNREISLNEIRISIKDFTQLKGLYLLLDEMKLHCKLPAGGGIHIHVDLSRYITVGNRSLIKDYLTKNLHKLKNIFPKYEGTYNKYKVGSRNKGTYINISRLDTLEFRIAPLTFDYSTLIKWIIGCQKITSEVLRRCHLTMNLKSDPTKESINLGFSSSELIENSYSETPYMTVNGVELGQSIYTEYHMTGNRYYMVSNQLTNSI